MAGEEPEGRKLIRTYAQAGRYITLGLQYGISILLCLFIGWWLDEKLSTFPLLLIVGTFFGAGAGFYNLYKTLIAGEKKKEESAD